MNYSARRWLLGLTGLCVVTLCQADDPHAQHRQQLIPGYARSIQDYRIPDLKLLRDDGVAVAMPGLFATDRPVVVSFIFTSCSAICPVLTATLAQTRQRLGPDAERLRIISVSIDPEHDTPARLREYARQFQAGGDWRFYTGERAAIVALQKAFNAYRGDKNNHAALALIRPAGQSRWVRVEGFANAADLATEIKRPPET
jgi:protein SCO1